MFPARTVIGKTALGEEVAIAPGRRGQWCLIVDRKVRGGFLSYTSAYFFAVANYLKLEEKNDGVKKCEKKLDTTVG